MTTLKFITAIFDIDQPYSCSEWGELPVGGGTQIIDDDPNYEIFNLFESENAIPSTVWIDHEMRVHNIYGNSGQYVITENIESMLDACGDLWESHRMLWW